MQQLVRHHQLKQLLPNKHFKQALKMDQPTEFIIVETLAASNQGRIHFGRV